MPESFDPKTYCPQPIAGVIRHDRGDGEPSARYLLLHPERSVTVVLSERENELWDLMDGKTTVDGICQQYLMRRRTLVLNDMYTLIKRLGDAAILASAPGVPSQPELPQRLPGLSLPGSTVLPRLIARLPLMPHRAPVWMLALVGIIFGFVLAATGPEQHIFPEQGHVPGYLTDQLLLLAVLFLIFGFLRESFRLAVEGHYTKHFPKIRLTFYGPWPIFRHDNRWRLTLPRSKRLAASLSGIVIELLAGGLCAALLHTNLQPHDADLLYKTMWVLYARAFLHLCPLLRADLTRALEEWLTTPSIRKQAIGFLRYGFLPSFFSDERMAPRERVFLGFNAALLTWILLSAQFALAFQQNISPDIQQLMDLIQSHGTAAFRLTQVLFLLTFAPFVFGGLVAVSWCCWALYERLRQSQLLLRPGIQLAVGALAALVALAVLALGRTFTLYSEATELVLLQFLTIAILTAAVPCFRDCIAGMGSSRLGTRVLLMILAIIAFSIASAINGFFSVPPLVTFAFFGMSATLALAALLYAMVSGRNWWTFRRTSLSLAETKLSLSALLLLLVSAWHILLASDPTLFGTVFGVMSQEGGNVLRSSLHALMAHRVGFAAVALAILGLFDYRNLPVGTTPSDSRLILSQDDRKPSAALSRATRFLFQETGDELKQVFGQRIHGIVEQKTSKTLQDPAFCFQQIKSARSLRTADAEALARERIAGLLQVMSHEFGGQLTRRILCTAFDGIGWPTLMLLHETVIKPAGLAAITAPLIEVSLDERQQTMRSVTIFADAEEREKDSLIALMRGRTFQPGQTIVREGDDADECFVVIQGNVQIETRTSTGQAKVLAFLGRFDIFGEAALLHEATRRSATVRAVTEVTLLCLSRSDFQLLALQHPQLVRCVRLRLLNLRLLARTPIFRDLQPELLRVTLPYIDTLVLDEGDYVVHKGDKSRDLYVIKSGYVNVVAANGNQEEFICQLGPKDYFGEISLLFGVPRTATVRCSAPCELLVIRRDAAERLIDASEIFTANLREVGAQRRKNDNQ